MIDLSRVQSQEPSPAMTAILNAIRVVQETGDPSRPRSLAVTRLEEGLFWLQHDEVSIAFAESEQAAA